MISKIFFFNVSYFDVLLYKYNYVLYNVYGPLDGSGIKFK